MFILINLFYYYYYYIAQSNGIKPRDLGTQNLEKLRIAVKTSYGIIYYIVIKNNITRYLCILVRR